MFRVIGGAYMSLKKQLIKNYLKMQLVSSDPGILKIKVNNLPKLNEDYLQFAPYIYEFLKLKQGINEIQPDFTSGVVTIYYDSFMQPQEIITWINTVIDVAIDQMDYIAANWEINQAEVINTLKKILIGKMFQ